RADRRGLLAVPLAAAATAVGVPFADLIAPVIGRRGAGASCVFPFCLREQSVRLVGHPGEPRHILLGVVQTDVDHGLPTALPAAGADMRIAIPMSRAGIPFVERQ